MTTQLFGAKWLDRDVLAVVVFRVLSRSKVCDVFAKVKMVTVYQRAKCEWKLHTRIYKSMQNVLKFHGNPKKVPGVPVGSFCKHTLGNNKYKK